MSDDMQNYINEMHKQGHSDEEIREKLKEAGWKQEQIDQITTVEGEAPKAPGAIPEKDPANKPKRSILFVLLGVLVLSVAGLGFVYFVDIWESDEDFFEEIEKSDPSGVSQLPSITEEDARASREALEGELSGLVVFYILSESLLEVDVNNPESSEFCRQMQEGLREDLPGLASMSEAINAASSIPNEDIANIMTSDVIAKWDFLTACSDELGELEARQDRVGFFHNLTGRMLDEMGVDVPDN